MAITLIHTGRTPSMAQFSLDQFTEHYKTDSPADVVATSTDVPQKGDAHPDFPFMFVTDRHPSETPSAGATIDLVYTGALRDTFGTPILPPQRHEDDNAVMSASSSRAMTGTVLTSPLTVQYYSPTRVVTWFSYNGPGERGTVGDPTDDIEVITATLGDTTFSPTGLIADLIQVFFTPLLVGALKTTEVVAGKFWQNTERRHRTLSPWIFALTAGNYIVMFAPGQGYTVGNLLTISSGLGSATMRVDSIGIGNSVRTYTTISNTFTVTTTNQPPMYSRGGSGSGAAFYNINIP